MTRRLILLLFSVYVLMVVLAYGMMAILLSLWFGR